MKVHVGDDPFATCTEAAAAASEMRLGVYVWEGVAVLADGRPVVLKLAWQPEFDGPLGPVVATARTNWPLVHAAKASFRRAFVADLSSRWRPVLHENIPPTEVRFAADGSAEFSDGAFMDGEHDVVVEVSPSAEYLG